MSNETKSHTFSSDFIPSLTPIDTMEVVGGLVNMPRYEGYVFVHEKAMKRDPPTIESIHQNIWNTQKAKDQNSSNDTWLISQTLEQGWVERWCSLEVGKLLVYPDRTAAMVRPEDVCLTVHVGDFDQLHTSESHGAIASQGPWELTLSKTKSNNSISTPSTPIDSHPHDTYFSAKFNQHGSHGVQYPKVSSNHLATPKSATFAPFPFETQHSPVRRRDSETTLTLLGGPCLKSLSSLGDSLPRPGNNGLADTTNTTTTNASQHWILRQDSHGYHPNPWSKLTSTSRKLYRLVARASSHSLSEHDNLTTSRHAVVNKRDHHLSQLDDIDDSSNSGSSVSSPITPQSLELGLSFPLPSLVSSDVVLRITCPDALTKWSEALSHSMRGGTDRQNPALLSFPRKYQYSNRRIMARTTQLSSIPRLGVTSSNSDYSLAAMHAACIDTESWMMTEAAVQSRRRRQESLSSLLMSDQQTKQPSPPPHSSYQHPLSSLLNFQTSELLRRRQRRIRQRLSDIGDLSLISNNVETFSRPSTSSGATNMSPTSNKISHSHHASIQIGNRHVKSDSIASSLFISSAVATRSNSTRSASADHAKTIQPVVDCRTPAFSDYDVRVDHVRSENKSASFVEPRFAIGESPVKSPPSLVKHGRSASLLGHGSMKRIVAWRDGLVLHHSSSSIGLGLDLGTDKLTKECLTEKGKEKRGGFSKLRAFQNRPNSQPGKRDSLSSSTYVNPETSKPNDGTLKNETTSPLVSTLTNVSPLQPTIENGGSKFNHRPIPRPSSFLNLSKLTFGSSKSSSSSRFLIRLPSSSEASSSPPLQIIEKQETIDSSYEFTSGLGDSLVDLSKTRLSLFRLGGSTTKPQLITPELNQGISSPKAIVEKILPPQHIISTFDRLRLTRQSCDTQEEKEEERNVILKGIPKPIIIGGLINHSLPCPPRSFKRKHPIIVHSGLIPVPVSQP